ncbi:MAG TPA: TRAP transporter large permease subunit [Burkholderiaceae bacterium]|nr:TRAP transporter large permease subunit [Burkholderiaceae bacterium]
MRKELWFGFSLMALIVGAVVIFMPWTAMTNGHFGLLMLALVVVAIMLGFPTAFTLMGMGMIFAYFAFHSGGQSVEGAVNQTLNLMVQRAYAVMTNDVLISIPLFVFMGYLVERANLIEKLFKSLHLSLARVPGSLAVATLFTCAVFATATGIVGAVVTLMGLLAFPAMLRAGYSVQVSAGAITAGGCLGILIPPSVMLIVYGATAGVSVVQLYAGAFFPGLMLAGLYVLYVIILAKIKPDLMPPLPEAERKVSLSPVLEKLASGKQGKALPGLLKAIAGQRAAGVSRADVFKQLSIALLPFLAAALILGITWRVVTDPDSHAAEMESKLAGTTQVAAPAAASGGLAEPPGAGGLGEPPGAQKEPSSGLSEPPSALKEPPSGLSEPPSALKEPPSGLAEPPASKDSAGGLAEPPGALKEPPAAGVQEPPAPGGLKEPPAAGGSSGLAEPPGASSAPATGPAAGTKAAEPPRQPAPKWFWIFAGVVAVGLTLLYGVLSWARLELFKMLLGSFFPLAVMILAVLGTIVFGLATPTEAAAVGAFGGFALAAAYMLVQKPVEEARMIAKTWAPFWALIGSVVIWTILIKLEITAVPVPKLLGVITAVTTVVWCVMALRQVRLTPAVSESVMLTGKTSAMVCWLFVGSSIFSAAFALLGGQELIENWVMSLGLTKIQFLVLSQVIIFLLGWPLEWTEIIVIFMPIFIPLLDNFGVDPLFFGLLVALNLQTAFLSPPVAMAAFYLKGVSPPHVTLNQIFAGMLPFMGIQVLALVLLYVFPEIGMWLPTVLYRQ